MSYCVYADVVPFLPSGGLPNPARTATGSASGDYIESDGHGLADGTPLTVRAATGGLVPSPLVVGTTYYAKVLSPSRFQVAATSGGAAINLTTDGSNFMFEYDLPWSGWISSAASLIDSVIGETAPHVVPLVPDMTLFPASNGFPPLIVQYNAELAALMGLGNTAGASLDLSQRRDAIVQLVRAWAKRAPIRGVASQVQQPVNLAVTASAGATDPRGWANGDNTRIP